MKKVFLSLTVTAIFASMNFTSSAQSAKIELAKPPMAKNAAAPAVNPAKTITAESNTPVSVSATPKRIIPKPATTDLKELNESAKPKVITAQGPAVVKPASTLASTPDVKQPVPVKTKSMQEMDAAPKTPPAVITSLPKPIVKKDKDPAGKQ